MIGFFGLAPGAVQFTADVTVAESPTPVGQICLACETGIVEGDTGYLLDANSTVPHVVNGRAAYHRNCLLRSLGMLV